MLGGLDNLELSNMSGGSKGKKLIIPPFAANNHLLSPGKYKLDFLCHFFLSFPVSLFFRFIVSISAFLILKLPFFPHSPLSHWSTTKMQDRAECEEALEFHMQSVNTGTTRKTHMQEQTPATLTYSTTPALHRCPLNSSHARCTVVQSH